LSTQLRVAHVPPSHMLLLNLNQTAVWTAMSSFVLNSQGCRCSQQLSRGPVKLPEAQQSPHQQPRQQRQQGHSGWQGVLAGPAAATRQRRDQQCRQQPPQLPKGAAGQVPVGCLCSVRPWQAASGEGAQPPALPVLDRGRHRDLRWWRVLGRQRTQPAV
jgi:hypothetical protein